MKTILFFIVIFFHTLPSSAQITLTVEIENLKNNKGQILLELKDKNDKRIQGLHGEIINNRCVIIINDLAPGEYSFKYFHDENKNNELDVNFIGMPKEGFGFSNNAKGSFGQPDFADTLFKLNKPTTAKCTAIYLMN